MKIDMKLQLTDLLSNKTLIINIIIILIALLISFSIFRGQVRDIELLKMKKDNEIKRNEALGKISQLEKKINSYKNTLNKDKKDIPLVLNRIRDIANESAVKIISIEPGQEEDHPHYIEYSFDLAINADTYHTIGEFISNLESYSGVFLVDKLVIRSVEKYKESDQAQQDLSQTYSLSVDLTLTTFVLKD